MGHQPFREDVRGYESLQEVLDAAFDQAARGKGKQRHARGQAFENQRMQTISDLMGDPKGMLFQAIKKATEAMDLPTYEAKLREILGAIVYLAGLAIWLKRNDTDRNEHEGPLLEDEAAAVQAATAMRNAGIMPEVPSFLQKEEPAAPSPKRVSPTGNFSAEQQAFFEANLRACPVLCHFKEVINQSKDGEFALVRVDALKAMIAYTEESYPHSPARFRHEKAAEGR